MKGGNEISKKKENFLNKKTFTKENLKDLVEILIIKYKHTYVSKLKTHYKKYYNYALTLYPDKPLFSEKMYILRHEKDINLGKCIICGKPTSYINGTLGYNKTCSVECANISRKLELKLNKINELMEMSNNIGEKQPTTETQI